MAGRAHDSWRAARAVLAPRQLRDAVLGYAAALTAEWMFTVAVAVVAFRDGGAAGVGLVAVARMLPSALAGPFLSAFADRARREHVLAAVSLVRAVAIGGAAILLGLDAHRVFVYTPFVVATVALSVFHSAHSALLPLLCTTTAELASANVVCVFMESVATLAGPAAAGALLAWSTVGTALATAALLSSAAAVLVVRLRYDAPGTAAVGDGPRVVRDTFDAVRTVKRHRELRWLFGAAFAQTYTRGALNVFMVVLALGLLGWGEPGVAALAVAVGVGGVVGSLAASLLVGSRHLGAWLVGALALWGAPLAVAGMVPTSIVAFALVAVVGLANSIVDVPFFTLPVRLVSDAILTRVFGLFESIVTIGSACGSAMTPLLIALVDVRGAMIVTGLVLPVVAAFAWRPLAALDEHLGVRDDAIAVLRSAPMLRGLPVPSIEYLAIHATRRIVAGGTAIVRQGDRGDGFFVLALGHVEVLGDGAPVGTMGPGQCFGEIALLRDVGRTATVRARDEVVVLEIGRAVFLDAVVGHGPTRASAHAVVAGHLAEFQPAVLGPAS